MSAGEPDAGVGAGGAIVRVEGLLSAAAAELVAAGARDEALAEYVVPRRVLGLVGRAPVMRPIARVWRLGVFLLAADGRLWATGAATRAQETTRPNYQSISAEQRREYRAAAHRGPFRDGETVNYDAVPIELDALSPEVPGAPSVPGATGVPGPGVPGVPLFVRNGHAYVRWAPGIADDAAIDLQSYLADRVGLLTHPPEGATPGSE